MGCHRRCTFRSVLRASAKALVLVTSIGGTPLSAQAADFVATNDAVLSGDIIRFAAGTVTIRLDVGRVVMLTPGDIKAVRLQIDDGVLMEGSFNGWQDGVYSLDLGNRVVEIKDNTLLSVFAKKPAPSDANPSVEKASKPKSRVPPRDHGRGSEPIM